MATTRHPRGAACVGPAALGLVEASKKDSRVVEARWAGVCTVLGRFEARNRPAGSSRAVPRSARWRGAPADAPPEGLGGVAKRSAYGSSFGAGWLAGAWRGAGSRVLLGALPSRDADLCLRLLDNRCSGGPLHGGQFQT